MLQIKGVLKSDEIKKITKKDGSIVEKRIVYVEPIGSVFPIKISIDDHNLEIGKIGNQISLDVKLYPYYFKDGKRLTANISYYIPSE